MSIITIQTENSEINKILKSLLEKINGVKVISETENAEIIGYKIDKTPIFADDYKIEIKKRISEIKSGKSKTFSTSDVLADILKK